jgi:hypothetical protein
VVVSASAGIVDAVEPGSVVVVPCGDPGALRAAVLRLIEQPAEAALVAARARAAVLRNCTLAKWIARIAADCVPPTAVDDRVELTAEGQE